VIVGRAHERAVRIGHQAGAPGERRRSGNPEPVQGGAVGLFGMQKCARGGVADASLESWAGAGLEKRPNVRHALLQDRALSAGPDLEENLGLIAAARSAGPMPGGRGREQLRDLS